MKRSIFKNTPAFVKEGVKRPDELFELYSYPANGGYDTVYLAEYHSRGTHVEIFTTTKTADAERHFFSVSEGKQAPVPSLTEWLDMAYPAEEEADNATLSLFEAQETL
ncbi:MAG: hypothetical protein H8D23_16685 [Candidatus Brocadiales bacterium]|nr:hypothetical protein [Candidatus Brocadiales bacterium]